MNDISEEKVNNLQEEIEIYKKKIFHFEQILQLNKIVEKNENDKKGNVFNLIEELSLLSLSQSKSISIIPINNKDIQFSSLNLNNSKVNANNVTTPFSSGNVAEMKYSNSSSKNNSTGISFHTRDPKPEKENYLGMKKKQPYQKMFNSNKSYNNSSSKSMKSYQTPNSKNEYMKDSMGKSKMIIVKDNDYVNDFVLFEKK